MNECSCEGMELGKIRGVKVNVSPTCSNCEGNVTVYGKRSNGAVVSFPVVAPECLVTAIVMKLRDDGCHYLAADFGPFSATRSWTPEEFGNMYLKEVIHDVLGKAIHMSRQDNNGADQG